jgi:hypothetical protein
MVFEVPASKRSIKQNQFEFSLDGKTYSIPTLKFAPVEAAEAWEQGQGVKAVMLAAGNPDAEAAIRTMAGDQFEALVNAWQEASGVEAGESRASTDS